MDASIFNYDRETPGDVREASSSSEDGVIIRDIEYASPLGDAHVAATIVRPEKPVKAAAVIWVHWLETHAENSNRTQFLPEAVKMARAGVVSILPATFWSTTPAEWEANPVFWWKTEYTHDRDLSVRQVTDLLRAIDILLAEPGVDASRAAYVGHDFGAMYGALIAGFDRRIKHFVLMAGTNSFSNWFIYGSNLDEQAREAYVSSMAGLDPARWIKTASPANLFFQFGDDDFYVPTYNARLFYHAASDPKSITWYAAKHDMQDAEGKAKRDRLHWLCGQLGLDEGKIP